MSLYNNYASEDELVPPTSRHQEWLDLYRAQVDTTSDSQGGVLAVFHAYIEHTELGYEHGLCGCGLLNAAAGLPVGSPGREAVGRHKEQVETILIGHLQLITTAQPDGRSGEHCALLLEGRWPRWRHLGCGSAGRAYPRSRTPPRRARGV